MNSMSTTIWNYFLLLVFIYTCNGVPRFANTFASHMVLQRAPQRAIVWGFGDPSTLTTLTIDGKTYATISESQLKNGQNESIWSVTLDPVEDEGPFDIHVTQPSPSGNVTITLHDVLFGDVWICSGQSNMEMTVGLIFNASTEMANSVNYPKIRLFTVASLGTAEPVEELVSISQQWTVPSAEAIGGKNWTYFSATCWLYGRMIHDALNKRPLGLIATSYGGTAIEYWMPPEALKECNTTENDKIATIESYDESISSLTFNHTNLFNAMIYPLTRMVIYGSIWYQGEANRNYNSDKYACNFAKLIEHWRQMWYQRTNANTNPLFPFGFVQLATYTNDSQFIGGMPWLRWHQTFDLGYVPNNVVPNIFMAVACDLRDDANGIHPRYKHDVGYRLSRSGLAIAYNQQIEFQGPIIDNVAYVSGGSTVNLTYRAVSSIELRNPNGFEVCCQGNQCLNDTIWTETTVTSKNNLTITITVPNSCIGQQLYGLRYLWRETPCLFKQAAVYSGTDSNLPTPPYLKIF